MVSIYIGDQYALVVTRNFHVIRMVIKMLSITMLMKPLLKLNGERNMHTFQKVEQL
jgi:hypothetical protein